VPIFLDEYMEVGLSLNSLKHTQEQDAFDDYGFTAKPLMLLRSVGFARHARGRRIPCRRHDAS
jgi:hypothetical protein